ncbi:MAG: family peptidase [Frankiales bacterium]|nr:family peptidase [Frankiales bacterium]
MRLRLTLAPVLLSALALGGVLAPAGASAPAPAPLGRYVVVLDGASATGAATRLVATLGGTVGVRWAAALDGFAATLPSTAVPLLRALPGVRTVERDAVVRVQATTQSRPPSYGLDRIDQRALPLSSSYTTRSTGAGVSAYVIDTGVRRDHTDLAGRVAAGFDAVDGGAPDDCNGHGTHVSGTVGGTRYGVAKKVRIVPVRVLDCEGSGENSQVISGLDYAVRDHKAGTPAVANMSLGGSASAAVDQAVSRLVKDGVTVAVAGGNDGGFVSDLLGASDACDGSPSRVAAALTVGATDRTDTRADYSDVGRCLDLFAPGTDITSAWYTSRTATAVLSGTSMATPHVAGAAALVLQASPKLTPAQVAQKLVSTATAGRVAGAGAGSPNRLLFVS